MNVSADCCCGQYNGQGNEIATTPQSKPEYLTRITVGLYWLGDAHDY